MLTELSGGEKDDDDVFRESDSCEGNLASGERRWKNSGPIGGTSSRHLTRKASSDIHAECRYGIPRLVIVNAEKIQLTGDKMETKLYRRHTGYPGGLKTASAAHVFRKDPTQLLTKAIKGMLPKTPLGNGMARKLRVYVGPNHPHHAQRPEPISL